MTKQQPDSKHCSLCGNCQSLDHFLSITSNNRTFYGSVCLNCLGQSSESLFSHKRKRKLQFEQDYFFPHFDDDGDDGSGGWDPEDRARTIKQLLSVDARARGAFFKKRKQKTEKRNEENKRHQKELKEELNKSLAEQELQREANDSLERLTPNSVTISTSHNTKKSLFGKARNQSLNFTLTENIQRHKSSKDITAPASLKETRPKQETAVTEKAETTRKTDIELPPIDPGIAVTNENLTQQFVTNEFKANSYQRLGQTFSFLSPFTREGTNVRNKFTGGSPDRLNNMFNQRWTTEIRQKKDDAISQELKESNAKNLYEQAKDIFKK